MTSSRRGFLGSAGLAASGLGAVAGLAGATSVAQAQLAPSRPEVAPANSEPFYGPHQAGITTPMQECLYFASFDLNTVKREDIVGLLQGWTYAAARLTAGLPVAPTVLNADDPPADSGETVGLNPCRLTMTFGFGPDLFSLNGEDRYGIAARRPAALFDLPRFAGDELVAGKCGGALSIQACANDPQVAFHAVRQLARISYSAASLKWAQSGFSAANKTQGTPRSLIGFKDGTMNPTAAAASSIVWAGAEGPAWMNGGTYMVARRIRIALEHWDRMKPAFQEQTIGRHKVSGAPLGGKTEFETADFAAMDAGGNPIIPDTSHVRLAAPTNNDGATILRRGYSYNDGASLVAERWPPWRQGIEYDSGLFFQAFQKDPRTGFIKVFDRMSKIDALNQFTTHTGSAIFACPPGVQPGQFIGQGLFDSD